MKKLVDRHLESPNHKEKVDSVVVSLGTLISATPRFIEHGKDIMRLTKEDSARHWMGVSTVMDTDGDETPARDWRTLEDSYCGWNPWFLRHHRWQ